MPALDLWMLYLSFVDMSVRDAAGDDPEKLEAAKATIEAAYELAVAKMGCTLQSAQIWTQYIDFLKVERAPASGSVNVKLRKVYQRAVAVPMHNLDAIWTEYEEYESNISVVLSKALIAEHQPAWQLARSLARERKAKCEGLLNMLARPPVGSRKEMEQAALWKGWIEYEKGNPGRAEPGPLATRVLLTYQQCLCSLRFFPDVWHAYAAYHVERNDPDSARMVFQESLKVLPDSNLLSFSYCDFEETVKQPAHAKKEYERLLAHAPSALVLIQFQRFVRRTEGKEAARKIFQRARKAACCSHHVYIAAAMLENDANGEQEVARKIFDLGMSRYVKEPVFVEAYIEFLVTASADIQTRTNNLRVVFERVLAAMPAERARGVWKRFLEVPRALRALRALRACVVYTLTRPHCLGS
jgi:cleavage stimulation factor subunit 3